MSQDIPRNVIEGAELQQPVRDDAAKEAEWLANNVPAERLELRWRYESGSMQLAERRLRSLPSYGVGPALCSYLRTRLEWLCDNKLCLQPSGVAVVTVETNGDVDIQLAQSAVVPVLTDEDLLWEGDALAGCTAPGTLFVHMGDELAMVNPQPMRDACETFAKDLTVTLAKSLGYTIIERVVGKLDIAGAEIALVNDALGLVVLQNHGGAYTDKLTACFNKLWSK